MIGSVFSNVMLKKEILKKPNLNFCMILKIAGKIGGRINEVDNALKKLKEVVELDQLSSVNVPQGCCENREYQENVRFRTEVRISLTLT